MTSQELFDKWYSEKRLRLNITYSAALQIWNASRSAIEVEIPASAYDEGSDYWFDDTFQHLRYERDVEREIKRHGITVKGE